MADKPIHTEIEIDAPPDEVWGVLSAFDDYPDWNPLVRRVLGSAEVGASLRVRLASPNGKGPITFRSKVVAVEPGRAIRWMGRFLTPRLLAGEHSLRVKPLDGGRCRFVQREEYRGILSRPVLWLFGGHIHKRFEEMNEALRKRVIAQRG